ncbi:hypothetical protein PVAG01_08746 [Phlyctema vagabunda]|uniref:Uncharacterized protein n=1 Tax=Phlyctema vagabunda TaxID=108571 RepID=A0ABR4PAR4_9HELO
MLFRVLEKHTAIGHVRALGAEPVPLPYQISTWAQWNASSPTSVVLPWPLTFLVWAVMSSKSHHYDLEKDGRLRSQKAETGKVGVEKMPRPNQDSTRECGRVQT